MVKYPRTSLIIYLLLFLVINTNCQVQSEESIKSGKKEVSVAVASNFADPIKIISQNFEHKTGIKVTLAFGSTGKHYAQIHHGAPFEVFLAADTDRPEFLEKEGLAVEQTRFTYALGRLILWSPQENFVDTLGMVFEKENIEYIAIANPRLAPYGQAAQEVLEELGQWDKYQGRIVRGENIGQTYQYIKSGNAELGLVACSQIIKPGGTAEGSYWIIPQELYTPIEQQAVLLKDNSASRAFINYLKSPEALEIIRAYGYGIPQMIMDNDDAQ